MRSLWATPKSDFINQVITKTDEFNLEAFAKWHIRKEELTRLKGLGPRIVKKEESSQIL
jgi:hypothetical protein